MNRKRIVLALLAVGAVGGFLLAEYGPALTADVRAADSNERGRAALLDPNGTVTNPFQYYPGTEALGPDEMRVTACGTGMPAARRGQAAACWVVELGNGDKFLFDLGTGSMANVQALSIPADYLTRVFISHLHTDHWGDLAALWAGGWTGGRTRPLDVWGPSGAREDMGTKYAVERFLEAYNWDYTTRAVKISSVPGQITVHEFDYKGLNEVVYEENGVVIRSIPAIHAGDGPVSFILEWNGFKFVYGGDTTPNKWFMEYCRDADFVIHECMLTPQQLMTFYGQPAARAMMMNTDIHTSAQAFGKIMSEVAPRHAVAYHFFNEEGTRYGIHQGIRSTYDGPLSMATDNMVWNITRDGIRERMVVSSDEAWDTAGPTPPPLPDNKYPSQATQWIEDGRLDWQDLEAEWFGAFKEKHGLK